MSYLRFKRFCDFSLSFLALTFLLPFLLLVALLIRCSLGSPILFCQLRPGYGEQPFRLLKFRTMTNFRDINGALLPDVQRLTPLGRWLRATSIDELPELVNILKGEMSFIGPRPLLMHYLPFYTPEQARRHNVKPGFSGLAQINGRNAISWEEKFRLDVWYVDHQSFWLDFRIFLITFWIVIRRQGINASGDLPVAPFTGSDSTSEVR